MDVCIGDGAPAPSMHRLAPGDSNRVPTSEVLQCEAAVSGRLALWFIFRWIPHVRQGADERNQSGRIDGLGDVHLET